MRKYEAIHQRINVYSVYKNRKTYIKAFEWEHRPYRITHNNLQTRAYKGQSLVYLFAVSNEKGAYKLRLDTDTLAWWLEEVLWEE